MLKLFFISVHCSLWLCHFQCLIIHFLQHNRSPFNRAPGTPVTPEDEADPQVMENKTETMLIINLELSNVVNCISLTPQTLKFR